MGAKRKIRAVLVLSVAAIVSAIAASSAAAAPSSAHGSVIGGKPASIAEFPWLAYISGADLSGEYSCTGTVIAPRVVLTAAHCVQDPELADLTPAANFRVATGTADRLKVSRSQISTVSRALVNPGFNLSKIHGDAALLILSAPVAAPTLPIASAADATLLTAGTPVSIAGWGLADYEDENGPALLQSGANLVQSVTYCKRHSRQTDPDYSPALQLCAIDAPNHAVSACFGDSGGPAIARRADGTPVQVGITSLGEPECSPESPTVFTRVDRLSAWVSGWIAAVEAGGPAPRFRRPHLPTLLKFRAENVSLEVLENDFPRAEVFEPGTKFECARLSKESIRCDVGWPQGRDDYFGAITSFYKVEDHVAAVAYRYAIHWVSHRCRTQRSDPATCPVHTRRR